jgi:cbb3-type cytochrome oxidase maturation protein
MDVIYGLIPGMIILGLVMVGVLFWAARSGQFEDLEGDAHRILMDDDIEQWSKGEPSQADAHEKNSDPNHNNSDNKISDP